MFLCHSAVLRLESFSLSLCHASAASASRKLTNQRSLSRSCECIAIVTYIAGCSESQIQLRQCLWPSVANLIKFVSCVVLIPCVAFTIIFQRQILEVREDSCEGVMRYLFARANAMAGQCQKTWRFARSPFPI